MDESLIQEQTEQDTIQEEFIETEKGDDAVKKEDSVLEDVALKPEEESNNILQKRADTVADSNETIPPKQNSVPADSTSEEQNNEFTLETDSEENTEVEETEENPADSSEE